MQTLPNRTRTRPGAMARGLVALALCLTLVSAYMPVPAAAAPQDEVAVTLPKPPRQPRPPLDPQTPSDGQTDPVQPPTVRIPGAPVLMAGTPATYTVTTTSDSTDNNTGDGVCADALGRCSLRAAVQQANAHAGDDTILLPAGTYTLSLSGGDEQAAASGDLDILENLTIIGAGGNADGNASATVIDGGGIDRVFSVNPFPWDKIVNATFKALTIQNGKPVGTGDYGTGGGID
ncbi:MAG TPA: CSLREA domain-containing protein, partial [Symbiobacteriaceae bacterium]|nr:CSLREA domain-containing protein [Symbiobacteriaceae bacterium]